MHDTHKQDLRMQMMTLKLQMAQVSRSVRQEVASLSALIHGLASQITAPSSQIQDSGGAHTSINTAEQLGQLTVAAVVLPTSSAEERIRDFDLKLVASEERICARMETEMKALQRGLQNQFVHIAQHVPAESDESW